MKDLGISLEPQKQAKFSTGVLAAMEQKSDSDEEEEFDEVPVPEEIVSPGRDPLHLSLLRNQIV